MHIFATIEQANFESAWYWLLLICEWSILSNRIYGVPATTILRAKKLPAALEDVEDLFSLFLRRFHRSVPKRVEFYFGAAAFLMGLMTTVAWGYDNALAQALFILVAPLILIGLWSFFDLQRPHLANLSGQELRKFLLRRRFKIQVFGLVWITASVFWGTYVTLRSLYYLSP